MEYHEVGEKFDYDGVMLEVVEFDAYNDCPYCYFFNKKCPEELLCNEGSRLDHKAVIYKLVEQCKPKDMEQKTEIIIEGTDRTFATQVTNIQSDEEIYGSLLEK